MNAAMATRRLLGMEEAAIDPTLDRRGRHAEPPLRKPSFQPFPSFVVPRSMLAARFEPRKSSPEQYKRFYIL